MLEEVGQPYRTVVVDYAAMKSPDYLAVNPMGKVPSIAHRGVVVTEHRDQRGIGGEDRAVWRGPEETDRHALEQPTETLFRRPQRFFSVAPARNVFDHHQRARDAP